MQYFVSISGLYSVEEQHVNCENAKVAEQL
jgi:hypothetical protein